MSTQQRPLMIVTGASRGIGAEVAVLAAGRGYDLCLNYGSDHQSMERVESAARTAGARTVSAAGDIADEDVVVALFAAATAEFGRLDVLVNNAGIVDSIGRLENFTVQRIRRTFDVNVLGSFLCAREAVRLMSTHKGGNGGAIVNVSSAASYLGTPGEFIDYAASKGAVDSMTIGLAKEVATEGIRVNAVRPGLIETEIHARAGKPNRVADLAPNVPMQRGGSALEVAEAVLWLASSEASYVTGALLNVAGGR
ncbi:MAG: SDR family oxidoreductase [Actinomycetota bacterium]|nr:SDR family oxidoreductase [Actinomycetota bacterium]